MDVSPAHDVTVRRPPLGRIPWWLWLAAPAFAVFLLHSSLGFGGWLADDAGISFAYAHNFIRGHGFIPQVGAPRVEGFSTPLWTVLLPPLFVAALLIR
jgi:hypothetical protein